MLALIFLGIFAVVFLYLLSKQESSGGGSGKPKGHKSKQPIEPPGSTLTGVKVVLLQELNEDTNEFSFAILADGQDSSYIVSITGDDGISQQGQMTSIAQGVFALALTSDLTNGSTYTVSITNGRQEYTKVFPNIQVATTLSASSTTLCEGTQTCLIVISTDVNVDHASASVTIGGSAQNLKLTNQGIESGTTYMYTTGIAVPSVMTPATVGIQLEGGDVLYTTQSPVSISVAPC
jgi:hypothetical protein